jgi:uncharacterized protein (TIGR03435 family)
MSITRFLLAGALVVPAFAQPAPAPAAFEVASVRPNQSNDGHSDINTSSDQDAVKLTMRNVKMLRCIQAAYGVKAYQIEGPDC